MSDIRYTVTYRSVDGLESCLTTTDRARVLEAYKSAESDCNIFEVMISEEVIHE